MRGGDADRAESSTVLDCSLRELGVDCYDGFAVIGYYLDEFPREGYQA